MADRQSQKSGEQSVNIQSGGDVTVSVGLSFTEARQLFKDLFNENFYRLTDQALETARVRADELVRMYLEQLSTKNPTGLASALDPDMQYAIVTAQKEYARSGDKDLGQTLVDLLVERSAHIDRSLTQIVLNESLSTVPRLTNGQISTLATVFLLRYTTTYTGVAGLSKVLQPFVVNIPTAPAEYVHLQYTGCAYLDGDSISLEKLLNQNHAVQKTGLSVSSESSAAKGKIVPLASRRHSDLETRKLLSQVGLLAEPKMALLEKSTWVPVLEATLAMAHNLTKAWAESPISRMLLTTVGIGVAIASVRAQCNEVLELRDWLTNEPESPTYRDTFRNA